MSPSELVDLGGSSDHFGFAQAGIPTGGLFAGASETGGRRSPARAAADGAGPLLPHRLRRLDNVDLARVGLFAAVTLDVVRELTSAD